MLIYKVFALFYVLGVHRGGQKTQTLSFMKHAGEKDRR